MAGPGMLPQGLFGTVQESLVQTLPSGQYPSTPHPSSLGKGQMLALASSVTGGSERGSAGLSEHWPGAVGLIQPHPLVWPGQPSLVPQGFDATPGSSLQ